MKINQKAINKIIKDNNLAKGNKGQDWWSFRSPNINKLGDIKSQIAQQLINDNKGIDPDSIGQLYHDTGKLSESLRGKITESVRKGFIKDLGTKCPDSIKGVSYDWYFRYFCNEINRLVGEELVEIPLIERLKKKFGGKTILKEVMKKTGCNDWFRLSYNEPTTVRNYTMYPVSAYVTNPTYKSGFFIIKTKRKYLAYSIHYTGYCYRLERGKPYEILKIIQATKEPKNHKRVEKGLLEALEEQEVLNQL